MGDVGRGTQAERSSRFPAARREDSTSRIRQVWEGLKEKLSGVHRISQIPGPIEKTPVPSYENDRAYRMVCLQKIDDSRKGVHGGSPFWEHDFETVMDNAKAAFRGKRDGSDHINQEICARMLGVSIEMVQMGKLELFVKAEGAEYLKWGEKNLMDPDMRALCTKMLKKISALSRRE